MSSSTPESRKSWTAAVLTVSDSSFRGEREDTSGPAVTKVLQNCAFRVIASEIVPDERATIETAIRRLAGKARLVVTTGGTGIAERDVTPEATRAVCSRLLEGVAERMRAEGARKTPLAVLSRGVCGVHGKSIVLNVPGSPKGAAESLEAVIEALPHALQLLNGNTEHSETRSQRSPENSGGKRS